MDTLFADISEWQVPVTDVYPHPVLSIRVCDGTYRDHNFAQNYTWARGALDSGRLTALIIYLVYRPNWDQTLATAKSAIGSIHPRAAVMIDVESWGGKIIGDNSSSINELYWGLADWVGDPRRIIGYGNVGDLNQLWPIKPSGIRLVVAAYGSNPDYPGKIAHQFADNYVTPPFGACDINSADGTTPEAFCAALGIGGGSDTAQPPTTRPIPVSSPGPDSIPLVEVGQTNDTIRHLQEFLNRVFPSYSALPVTGFYGPMTTSVIREFQRRSGIVGGDGRNVGTQTRAKLFEYGFRG